MPAKKPREANNGQLFEKRSFTVIGTGRFAFDMLRYDACWPSTEQDSHQLSRTDHDEVRRAVVLYTHAPTAPTAGRWKSLGWTVTSINGETVDALT